MDFEIPCETFVRLSHVTKELGKYSDMPELKSIYIERKNGKLFAIATNRIIMAIEFLGENPGNDEHVKITVDPVLVEQCKTEIPFNSNLHVNFVEMLGYATIKTTLGYEHSGNGAVMIEGETDIYNWRKYIPDEMPKKHKGSLWITRNNIVNLVLSAPSQELCFPEFIDVYKPVIIRDRFDEKWLGVFLSIQTIDGKVKEPTPAKLPNWI